MKAINELGDAKTYTKKKKKKKNNQLHIYSPRGALLYIFFLLESSESLRVLPVEKYRSLLHFIH